MSRITTKKIIQAVRVNLNLSIKSSSKEFINIFILILLLYNHSSHTIESISFAKMEIILSSQ